MNQEALDRFYAKLKAVSGQSWVLDNGRIRRIDGTCPINAILGRRGCHLTKEDIQGFPSFAAAAADCSGWRDYGDVAKLRARMLSILGLDNPAVDSAESGTK